VDHENHRTTFGVLLRSRPPTPTFRRPRCIAPDASVCRRNCLLLSAKRPLRRRRRYPAAYAPPRPKGPTLVDLLCLVSLSSRHASLSGQNCQPKTSRQVVLTRDASPFIKQSKTDTKRAHQAADNILDRRWTKAPTTPDSHSLQSRRPYKCIQQRVSPGFSAEHLATGSYPYGDR
jgi:hypothetical protein